LSARFRIEAFECHRHLKVADLVVQLSLNN
jgi:hypothetical protein